MTIRQPGSLGLYFPADKEVGPAYECFICGNALGCRHAVMWQGSSGQIWLHAACALYFGVHLIADANKADAEEHEGINSPSRLMREAWPS